MTYIITAVEFDTDGDKELAQQLKEEYVGTSVEVDDEDEIADTLSDISGWCIFSINYEKKED